MIQSQLSRQSVYQPQWPKQSYFKATIMNKFDLCRRWCSLGTNPCLLSWLVYIDQARLRSSSGRVSQSPSGFKSTLSALFHRCFAMPGRFSKE